MNHNYEPLATWERELYSGGAVPVMLSVAMEGGRTETVHNVDVRSIAFQSVRVVQRHSDDPERILCLTFETCDNLNPVIYTFPNVTGWSSLAE